MKMHLNSHVLIPRADTECLVQAVLDVYPSSRNARVVDCGTGSGAIALALAHERAHWDILGVDQSEQSVLCARDNQRRLGISQTKVSFSTLSWNALPTTSLRYDIVVANPPYIDQNDPDIHPHVHLHWAGPIMPPPLPARRVAQNCIGRSAIRAAETGKGLRQTCCWAEP